MCASTAPRAWIAQEPFEIIDIHVHSRYTRGCEQDPALVIKRARELGLDGICFTDLNSIGTSATELHRLGKAGPLKVFVGMELTTDRRPLPVLLP